MVVDVVVLLLREKELCFINFDGLRTDSLAPWADLAEAK